MSTLPLYIANTMWKLASLPAAQRFSRALGQPQATQRKLLQQFLKKNASSQYGVKHGYGSIRTVEEFQQQTPIVSYEDLLPWVQRIVDGEQNVLTAEPVQMMEATSGSTTARKLIPYTASLRREFQSAVGAWMVDLYRSFPLLQSGRQYWSLSPAARQQEFTAGGLPIGFTSDAEYLSSVEQAIVKRVLATPPGVGSIACVDAHRRATMRYLADQKHLKLLSVWSPVFLIELLRHAPAGFDPAQNWPQLQLISCWTSGASGLFKNELQQRFPNVAIQGKGLLATEGVVSIPLHNQPAPAPALTSHFLEFLDEDNVPHLAGGLTPGQLYQPLLTCGNGFARYRLGDVVRAVSPLYFEFVGRGQGCSDLCGEKLSEAFVASAVQQLHDELSAAKFLTLAPCCQADRRGYVLVSDCQLPASTVQKLDDALSQSVHYAYCRQLGQLAAIRLCVVPGAASRHTHLEVQRGRRAGDIKLSLLQTRLNWLEEFGAALDVPSGPV